MLIQEILDFFGIGKIGENLFIDFFNIHNDITQDGPAQLPKKAL